MGTPSLRVPSHFEIHVSAKLTVLLCLFSVDIRRGLREMHVKVTEINTECTLTEPNFRFLNMNAV